MYGVPWIPSIYPLYVSILEPAPAGSAMGIGTYWNQLLSGNLTVRYGKSPFPQVNPLFL